VNDEKQYRALMTTIGRADVLDDPRFGDWFLRKENEASLREIIDTALARQDAKAWEKELNGAGAPSASIWTIEEVIAHPQIVAREVMQSVQTQYGMLRLMGSGFQMAHGGGHLDTAPPELGADSETILAELGYDPAAIGALRAEGVI
jgi:crotonobetainyl-CoA:carnitine CoA-transferase CaiB-like acyl-CoA transferase